MPKIIYPYLPQERKILYVSADNIFMKAAKAVYDKSSCVKHPTGAVVVKNGKIIGRGSNAGVKVEFCARWGSPTGANYEACHNICKQEGHAEITSIKDAERQGEKTDGADLYLYGHWWCCQTCRATLSRTLPRALLEVSALRPARTSAGTSRSSRRCTGLRRTSPAAASPIRQR